MSTPDVNVNNHISLVLVIPCYNEAQRLQVDHIQTYLFTNPHITFLFVNDGSRDHTLSVLESMQNNRQVKVLNLEKNQGKAEAVRQGIIQAIKSECDLVGFWDADMATPLDQIQHFIRFFQSHSKADVIFGSRVKLMGKHIERKSLRHYLGRVFATAASLILKLGIYDTQCGAKMFRNKPYLLQVFSAPFNSKWIFDVELLFRFKQYFNLSAEIENLALYELPLEKWTDIPGSKLNPTDFLYSFFDLIKLYFKYK